VAEAERRLFIVSLISRHALSHINYHTHELSKIYQNIIMINFS